MNGRTDYLSWDDFFMFTAILAAQRSKDPNTQVGACIADIDNKIVGIGYNGFPRGCSDTEFPWGKTDKNPLNNKYLYVVHAEQNAIHNCDRTNLSNTRIYVTMFPCNECAKNIIQSGIKKVYYLTNKYPNSKEVLAAIRMFDAAGIDVQQHLIKDSITLRIS